jgi:hypothetical protein
MPTNETKTEVSDSKFECFLKMNRSRLDNLDNFVNWYNAITFHESLDRKWYLHWLDTLDKIKYFYKLSYGHNELDMR